MIYFVFILVVHPNSGIKTVPDLIVYVKANPGKTSYAFGNSTGQVNGAFFVSAAKLDSLPVPYKSTPSAMTDLIAGQVRFMFVDAASSQGHVKGGRLRAIAVMSDKRSPITGDLPAVGETVPGSSTPFRGPACSRLPERLAQGGRDQTQYRDRQGHQQAGHQSKARGYRITAGTQRAG